MYCNAFSTTFNFSTAVDHCFQLRKKLHCIEIGRYLVSDLKDFFKSLKYYLIM